jgi:hypothetical protein
MMMNSANVSKKFIAGDLSIYMHVLFEETDHLQSLFNPQKTAELLRGLFGDKQPAKYPRPPNGELFQGLVSQIHMVFLPVKLEQSIRLFFKKSRIQKVLIFVLVG